jgi:hypothetical protein
VVDDLLISWLAAWPLWAALLVLAPAFLTSPSQACCATGPTYDCEFCTGDVPASIEVQFGTFLTWYGLDCAEYAGTYSVPYLDNYTSYCRWQTDFIAFANTRARVTVDFSSGSVWVYFELYPLDSGVLIGSASWYQNSFSGYDCEATTEVGGGLYSNADPTFPCYIPDTVTINP